MVMTGADGVFRDGGSLRSVTGTKRLGPVRTPDTAAILAVMSRTALEKQLDGRFLAGAKRSKSRIPLRHLAPDRDASLAAAYREG